MKKQSTTLLVFFGAFLLIITLAGSLVRVPVSNEEAIMAFLRENFGQSKTAWLDTIDFVQTSGTSVIVTTRKSRRNDAIEICEAVSQYIYSTNTGKIRLDNIEVRTSGKVIARRNGLNDHCSSSS